jgi:hypothetical protein
VLPVVFKDVRYLQGGPQIQAEHLLVFTAAEAVQAQVSAVEHAKPLSAHMALDAVFHCVIGEDSNLTRMWLLARHQPAAASGHFVIPIASPVKRRSSRS